MSRKRLCLMVLAALLFVTYVPIEDYDDEAVVITRDENGEWEYEGDSAFRLSLQLAKTTTTSRDNTTVTSSPDSGAWRCERIWILNTSDSDITRAVGVALQQELLKQAPLNEVAHFGHDELPLDVRRPPDLYVLLRLDESHGFVIPGYCRFGASLNIVAARRPDLAMGSLDHSGVPVTVKSEIECSSSVFGILTPSARRSAIAEAVVTNLDLETQLTWALRSATTRPAYSSTARVRGCVTRRRSGRSRSMGT